jgi:hypothetical protein
MHPAVIFLLVVVVVSIVLFGLVAFGVISNPVQGISSSTEKVCTVNDVELSQWTATSDTSAVKCTTKYPSSSDVKCCDTYDEKSGDCSKTFRYSSFPDTTSVSSWASTCKTLYKLPVTPTSTTTTNSEATSTGGTGGMNISCNPPLVAYNGQCVVAAPTGASCPAGWVGPTPNGECTKTISTGCDENCVKGICTVSNGIWNATTKACKFPSSAGALPSGTTLIDTAGGSISSCPVGWTGSSSDPKMCVATLSSTCDELCNRQRCAEVGGKWVNTGVQESYKCDISGKIPDDFGQLTRLSTDGTCGPRTLNGKTVIWKCNSGDCCTYSGDRFNNPIGTCGKGVNECAINRGEKRYQGESAPSIKSFPTTECNMGSISIKDWFRFSPDQENCYSWTPDKCMDMSSDMEYAYSKAGGKMFTDRGTFLNYAVQCGKDVTTDCYLGKRSLNDVQTSDQCTNDNKYSDYAGTNKVGNVQKGDMCKGSSSKGDFWRQCNASDEKWSSYIITGGP